MEKIISFYNRVLSKGILFIGMPMIIITALEVINAIGRKLFVPLPCTIEAVEALMVIITYFGVSFVAAEGGHVNVPLMTQRLPLPIQNLLDAVANFFGASIFGIWTWAVWLEALKALRIMEVRIGVLRFPIWPFKILFAVGLTMLVIQLFFNGVKFLSAALGHPFIQETKEEKPLLEM
jgi:TRAP-type C4-dicarboxylate transport system permease small subunit